MSATETPASRCVRDGILEFVDGAPVLVAGRCARCATLSFPRGPVCPGCQSSQVNTHRLSREGTIYAHTVVRSRPPDYHGPVPYGLAMVELQNGLRVFGAVIGDLATLEVGAPVEVIAFDVGDGTGTLSYAFRTSERETDA